MADQQRRGEGSWPNGSGPSPVGGGKPPEAEQRRNVVRRLDRMYGIMLFVIGVFATINFMSSTTEASIVAQAAALSREYGLTEYRRPDGLGAVEWTGIVLQPLNYAVWLYIALVRWKAGKQATWCAFVGALIAWGIASVLMGAGLAAHPDLFDTIMQRGLPGATPQP